MKKFLSLILGVAVVLSCGISAFADNSVTIQATVPNITYEMVIPSNVGNLTPEKHSGILVGAAEVKNVIHATDDTVISYTATCGDFVNNANGDIIMKASYSTDDAGTIPFPATVAVFQNNAAVDSPTNMYVGVAENDWNSAPAGDYSATVTFHFNINSGTEPQKTVTTAFYNIGEILATVAFPEIDYDAIPDEAWRNLEAVPRVYIYAGALKGIGATLPLSTTVEINGNGNYTCNVDNRINGTGYSFDFEFVMESNVLTAIKETKTYFNGWNPGNPTVQTYTPPQN